MGDNEPDYETTVTGTMSVGQPKFQASIPYNVRRVLGINDIDSDKEAIIEAEFRLKKIEDK